MPTNATHITGTLLAATVAVALLVAWVVLGGRRAPADRAEKDVSWAFALPYAFGCALCVFSVLPEPQWRRPLTEGGPAFTTVLLCVGVGLVLVGLVVHLTLRARGRLRGDASERASVPIALLLGAAAGGSQLLKQHGLDPEPWVVRGAMVVLAVLVVLVLVLAAFKLRYSPVSRMARLVVEGRHIDAIALAHTVPEPERDATWQHNLAVAYCKAGETERARALFLDLSARPDLPDPLRESVERWLATIARPEDGQDSSPAKPLD